jgi:hypothetical protein
MICSLVMRWEFSTDLPDHTTRGGVTKREVFDGDSGVEAAETGESDARDERERCARDGKVGVAQYVTKHPTGVAG